MPADDESLYRSVLDATNHLAQELGKVSARVAEETALALVRYREDVHRSIMGLHTRILIIEKHLDDDRAARIKRQEELDQHLATIRQSQVWRIRIEVTLVVVALVVYLWLRP